MITLIVMMVEVHYEYKKQDGHELEDIQERQIVELKIEEMALNLIQMQPTEMWDQLLSQAEILPVT